MAADATFNQSTGGNYKTHGGAHWKIGGTIEGLPGGVIDFSTAGCYVKGFIEDGTTTADLKPYGVSVVTKSSAAGAQTFTIGAPIVGVHKQICVIMADSSDTVRIDMASNGATLRTYTGQTLNTLVFATSGATNNWAGGIHMVGYTTAQWAVISQTGTIATTS